MANQMRHAKLACPRQIEVPFEDVAVGELYEHLGHPYPRLKTSPTEAKIIGSDKIEQLAPQKIVCVKVFRHA